MKRNAFLFVVWSGIVGVGCAEGAPGGAGGEAQGGAASSDGGASASGGGSAEGGGGSTSTGQPETIASVCQTACAKVETISAQLSCEALEGCQSDCQLGAYPGCEAEYFVLRKCWADNVALEVCSCPNGFLTCSICQAEEFAFQDCGGGF